MKKYKDSKGNIVKEEDLKYYSSIHLLKEYDELDVVKEVKEVKKTKKKVKKYGRRSALRSKTNNN